MRIKFSFYVYKIAYQPQPDVAFHDLVFLVHIDELNESQSEGNFYLLRHILHRSNEFIVASKEVTHQPLLFL